MFEIRPYPEFSWSHSRARLLDDCPRAYFHRYYGGHNGWLAESAAPARLAYRLRHLTTLHQVFGTAIHECARGCVEAVRRGTAPPTHAEMLAQVLGALRAACAASKDRSAFERDPKRTQMLHAMYYRGDWDLGEVAKVRTKLERCLAALAGCSVWEELRQVDPAGIVLVDRLETVSVGRICVYAAPDLVVRDGRHVTVFDWKTGVEVDEAEASLQLAVYALVVMRRFRWRFDDHDWSGRIIRLNDGEDQRVELSRLDLLRARHRISESVEEMRGFLSDIGLNQPKAIGEFPLALPAYRIRCPACVYYELCRPHLGGSHNGEGS